MRSTIFVSGEAASAGIFENLRSDAAGAGNLLAHQTLGAIALPTNPSNGNTLTLDINGTNVVITFVSSIGVAAGNVLIGASANATLVNLLALLNQPQSSTSTGVALSGANQALVSYLSWSLPTGGTTLYVSSKNTALYAPQTSFTASTTVSAGTYTANTMALYVEPGTVYVDGTRVLFLGGLTPTVTAPVGNPRIDVLSINSSGTLAWTTGTPASSPSAPAYPADQVALCELYNVVSETVLVDNTNQASGKGYISNDVRPFLQNGANWAAFTDSIIPSADGTLNLGSASYEWNNIYAKSGIYC